MKKTICGIAFLLALNTISYSQEKYYWYNSNKVGLYADSSTFYLNTNKTQNADTSSIKRKLASIFSLNDSSISQFSDSEFIVKSDKKIDIGLLNLQIVKLKYKAPLFRNLTGATFVLLPQIIVQLKESHSINEVLALYQGSLSLIKDKGFNTYILKCDVKSSSELLNISNFLNEKTV